MKKYIVVSFLLLLFIIPSVSFASWWNPLTWFSSTQSTVNTTTKTTKTKTPVKKPAVKDTGCAVGNLFSTTTGKSCTSTTTTITPTNTTTTTTPTIPTTTTTTTPTTPTIIPAVSLASKTNNYSVQDCYNECEYWGTASQRDLCKHSKATYSCDMYGKPNSALDNFVNNLKANPALQQNAAATGFTYSIQDCYNVCENYGTVSQRDICKHSNFDSCDMYGKPSNALDSFVNALKQNPALNPSGQSGVSPTNNQGQNATYDTGQ